MRPEVVCVVCPAIAGATLGVNIGMLIAAPNVWSLVALLVTAVCLVLTVRSSLAMRFAWTEAS